MQYIKHCILLFFLAEAVRQDQKGRRISNRLILTGTGCGILLRILTDGFGRAGVIAADLFLPVGLLFILYLFRVLGAGDLKLFSMISSFIGMKECFFVIYYAFLAGALLGLIAILKRRKWGLTKSGFAAEILLAYCIRMLFF